MKWRHGSCRQDIYAQAGDEPSPTDTWLATFGTVEDAEAAVSAVNDGPYFRLLALRERLRREGA